MSELIGVIIKGVVGFYIGMVIAECHNDIKAINYELHQIRLEVSR